MGWDGARVTSDCAEGMLRTLLLLNIFSAPDSVVGSGNKMMSRTGYRTLRSP